MQQLQDEARPFESPEIADALLCKVADDGGIAGADGDDDLIAQHDAQRDGGVHIAAALRLHIGNVNEDQRLLLVRVIVNTGRFFLVQRSRQEGGVQVEAGGQTLHLFPGGIEEMHPGALFQGGALRQMIIYGFENPLHVAIVLSW